MYSQTKSSNKISRFCASRVYDILRRKVNKWSLFEEERSPARILLGILHEYNIELYDSLMRYILWFYTEF